MKASKRERTGTAGRVAPLVLACVVEVVLAMLTVVLCVLLARYIIEGDDAP
jgi:hypothetical protein